MENRIFVGGLATSTDNRTFHDTFSSFGEILDAKVTKDRETGRSRGFGFVSMQDVIQGMNGDCLDGSHITVNEVVKPR